MNIKIQTWLKLKAFVFTNIKLVAMVTIVAILASDGVGLDDYIALIFTIIIIYIDQNNEH